MKPAGYIHLSVDDVIESLRDLEENQYESLWDQPDFLFFKNLNEQYGAVFSLYCFYTSQDGQWHLGKMSDRFKKEFEQSSHWLRFGFHAYGYDSRYGKSGNADSVQEATAHYSLITKAIGTFAGSSVIDVIPRVHFYTGTREETSAWRDSKNGITGLLTADDDREEVYYLDFVQRRTVREHTPLMDSAEGLTFFRTDFRFEKEQDPIRKLETMMQNGQETVICVFTHEDQLQLDSIKKKITDCCQWAWTNHYEFSFPMDLVPIH